MKKNFDLFYFCTNSIYIFLVALPQKRNLTIFKCMTWFNRLNVTCTILQMGKQKAWKSISSINESLSQCSLLNLLDSEAHAFSIGADFRPLFWANISKIILGSKERKAVAYIDDIFESDVSHT